MLLPRYPDSIFFGLNTPWDTVLVGGPGLAWTAWEVAPGGSPGKARPVTVNPVLDSWRVPARP